MNALPDNPEDCLLHRLGRAARFLALFLAVILLLLSGVYALWLWQAAEMRDDFTAGAIYAFCLRTNAALSGDTAFYQQAELILRALLALGFTGWILTFVFWAYHTCARARQSAPGAVAYRPRLCAILLLVPGVNIWMTYLVLRAARRGLTGNANAPAPALAGMLCVLQALNLLCAALSGFFVSRPEMADGIPLNTIGDMLLELKILLGGSLLPIFSYLVFYALLKEPCPSGNACNTTSSSDQPS